MNIQRYILPKWKDKIEDTDIPNNLELKYKKTGRSMAEYLDRKMMRSLPKSWFDGWVRYHFPLKVDPDVLKMHQVIAESFGEFVNDVRSGQMESFQIPNEEISKVENIKEEILSKEQEKRKKYEELRQDVEKLREEKKPEEARIEQQRRIKEKQEKAAKREKAKEEASEKVDHDYIYEKWMEEVDKKDISKSYWHIHEYMSRYILEFALEKNPETGELTNDILEEFLEDYGRGKRPKTMNHYNRVARYFWEFYDELINKSDK